MAPSTRSPIGYLNVRQRINGQEIRTVEVDEQRAPLVRWAFESYATGDWSLTALTDALQAEGLTTVPSAHYAEKPVPRSTVGRLLQNPYYTGKVVRLGVPYPGNHEPIIDDETFERVQHVLEAHNVAGGRDRVHNHYLKGSRLLRGVREPAVHHQDQEPARHASTCTSSAWPTTDARPSARSEPSLSTLVEAHIEDKWAHVQFDPEYAQPLPGAHRKEAGSQRGREHQDRPSSRTTSRAAA